MTAELETIESTELVGINEINWLLYYDELRWDGTARVTSPVCFFSARNDLSGK